jgi:EF-P beta-lysylation protein EpmB
MIAASSFSNQLASGAVRAWQRALANAISDPQELLSALELDLAWLPQARAAARLFPLRVPRSFVARMRPGDPHDPLLRQVLPLGEELHINPEFGEDPVGDRASRKATGVLQKYKGRVLLIATGACAVNCRYCFRRHFPYAEDTASSSGWEEALTALRTDPSVHEVILSGGDPLNLNDRRLTELTQSLTEIPHIKRLRIHTRLPVVLPERVDAGLLNWLANVPLQRVMVLHVNHAQEIDDTVRQRCREIAATGTTLLNQAVLLKGVNDDSHALTALSEALFAAGVLPYYLHMLDRVQGAAHFEVEEARAQSIMQSLMSELPGYLVPRLVREIPGAASKTPVPFWA